MTSRNQADLKADLLADLAPTPVVDAPAPVSEPVVTPPTADHTPMVLLAWTPLRWSRPRVLTVRGGIGKTLRVGPITVELSVKD